jgi:hypothetical protein
MESCLGLRTFAGVDLVLLLPPEMVNGSRNGGFVASLVSTAFATFYPALPSISVDDPLRP